MRTTGLLGTILVIASVGCSTDTSEGPHHTRRLTSPALVQFNSCSELTAELRANLKEEMRVTLEQGQDAWFRGGWGLGEPAAEMAGADDAAGGAQEGVDFSGTNNQEAGVDEADFFKNDGSFLYALNGNRLEMLAMPEPGQLEHTSRLELEGYPTQMLLSGNRVAVFSRVYTYSLPHDDALREAVGEPVSGGYWYPSTTLAKVTVIDTSNKQEPQVVKEVYVQGHYQTARKIDSTIRMLAYSWMNIPGVQSWPDLPEEYYYLDWDDPKREEIYAAAVQQTIAHNNLIIDSTPLSSFVPALYERTGATVVQHPFTASDCQQFAMAEDGMSRGITSILTLDILGEEFSFASSHIVTNWSTVYASKDVLLVAEPAQDNWWFWRNDVHDEATNIHRFNISAGATTVYSGSGRIPGTILNQFSLSEFNGDIRVASTTGRWARWWLEDADEVANHVYVLRGDQELSIIGQINDIAVGERIWSSRFVGEQAFLVTFQDIDPLWTIDLSVPENPTIKGELKVHGVSTYIHPIDDNSRLLTIGFGGDETGLDWATQVSTFDVSDFTDPTLTDAMSLAPPSEGGWSSAWSEASYEHKAFQYWPAARLLAIPLSTYRSSYTASGYSYEYLSRLELLSVGDDGMLSVYGTIDHSDFFNSDTSWWWSFRDVRRSTFVTAGDTTYIYAVSDKGITSHRLGDLTLQAAVELPGTIYGAYY